MDIDKGGLGPQSFGPLESGGLESGGGPDVAALRLAGVIPESVVDGPGLRYVVFVQGCPHGCPGCHNPETHDFGGGRPVTPDQLRVRIGQALETDGLLQGVTFSGGEPMCQAAGLIPSAELVKSMGRSLVVYTGYTYEELVRLDSGGPEARLLALTDILVDGPYIEAERDLTLHMAGSRNQRVIDMNKTREAGSLQFYQDWDLQGFGSGFEE